MVVVEALQEEKSTSVVSRLRRRVAGTWRIVKKVAEDDPRRVIHSIKVGVALTLVSSFYYFRPTYDSFGVTAMWAVMTVVVVFEYSVGALLGKCINRSVATLVAAGLGVGAHHFADLFGSIGEPILLGLFVFLQAAVTTFARMVPALKAKYDYGLMIFTLTFSLVSVSGYREDEILEFAHKRLVTVTIGCCVCILVSIVICPVWAGVDLHNHIANSLENLALSLEEFGREYLMGMEEEGDRKANNSTPSRCCGAYKSVLDSKAKEESLANFAWWEPCHGSFAFRHPWSHYLVIGTFARHCAYKIHALHSHLDNQVWLEEVDDHKSMKSACTQTTQELSAVLRALASNILNMTQPPATPIAAYLSLAKSSVRSALAVVESPLPPTTDIGWFVPIAAVASLLSDILQLVEKMAESTQELATLSRFSPFVPTVSPEKPSSFDSRDSCHVIVSLPSPPEDDSRSPECQDGSPECHGGSPERHNGSPEGHGRSPEGHSGSPEGHGGSPEGHGGSLEGHGRSPEGHGRSPKGKGLFWCIYDMKQ